MYNHVQRFARTRMVLPLRVWLDDGSQEDSPPHWAHTIDTSDMGCRIGGLRAQPSPGQIITLQRGQIKAFFRVIWSRQLQPREHQAGVEALNHNLNIWSVDPPPLPPPAARANLPASEASPSAVFSKTLPAARKITRARVTGIHRRILWYSAVALVLFSAGLASYFYLHLSSGSPSLAVLHRLPPPTAQDLARLTPKPRSLPLWLKKPLDASAPRLQVDEAPIGHVVYPVAPDNSITGKVRLQIVVAANGLVKQIHVVSGEQALAEAAARAVRFWRYASMPTAGSAKDRETSVTVSFLGSDAVSLQYPHSQTASRSLKNN